MNLSKKVLCGAVLSAAVMLAQPIPVYNTVEDYCRENPHAPTCKDGKPIDFKAIKVYTNPMQAWCDEHPNEPVCRKDSDSNSKAKTPATKTRALAPRLASPPEPAEEYRLPSPSSRRTRGSPSDIRLGELDWRLIQPHADLLIGINMASLLESELARTLIRQWTGKLGAATEEQDKLLANLGDVTQTVISVQGKDVLAVLVGRLDDFPEGAQVANLQSTRVSVDTVMMGSPGAITWARHRLNFGLLVSTPVKEAQQLSQMYHFWAWAKPSALAALGQAVSSTQVTKLKFGVNLKDQFRMDMIMDTANVEIAQKVLESSRKGAPREMQTSIEGASVHCALVLERDVALTRFASFMTDSVGKQFAPLLAAARQMARQAPATARSSPGKIIIEGLDDGPKTVTASTKQ